MRFSTDMTGQGEALLVHATQGFYSKPYTPQEALP